MTTEYRATLRIDPAHGAKRFQGVWLEHTDGTRWVVDYRARELWTWFAGREVIVTGETYAPGPDEQSIDAVHFRVASLRAASRDFGVAPYLSIGPVRELHGRFVTAGGAAGSKLAGSSWPAFVADDGTQYSVLGERPNSGQFARIAARDCEPDMSYAARTPGPDLWIVSIDADP